MIEENLVKFEKLQEEIIALSVLAAAARHADRDALLGHQLVALITPILPMIAERADEMTFVCDILSADDEYRRGAFEEGMRILKEEAAETATSPQAHAFRERRGVAAQAK